MQWEEVVGVKSREGTMDSIPGAWWNDVSTLDFILSGRQPLPILISATPPPSTKAPHILEHFSMTCALWSLHMLHSVLGNASCPALSSQWQASTHLRDLAEDVTFLILHWTEIRLGSLSPEHSVPGSVIAVSSWHSNDPLCAAWLPPAASSGMSRCSKALTNRNSVWATYRNPAFPDVTSKTNETHFNNASDISRYVKALLKYLIY